MKMLPVFICRQPEACAAVSACIDRITQRSSAYRAVCGKRFDTHVPVWPCWAKLNLDAVRTAPPGATRAADGAPDGRHRSWHGRDL